MSKETEYAKEKVRLYKKLLARMKKRRSKRAEAVVLWNMPPAQESSDIKKRLQELRQQSERLRAESEQLIRQADELAKRIERIEKERRKPERR